MPSGIVKIAAVALALIVAALLLFPRAVEPPPAPENVTLLPDPRPLPAFTLQDAAGGSFTPSDLAGGFSLMFFGFTNCPDVCPITLQILAATAERLASARGDADPAPEVVFVSVDPYRDTPERIRSYVDGFDPDFTGVTASDEALAPLLTALGVTVQKHEHAGENYNVVHNGTVYFIGPRAEWIGVSSPPHDPATLAADFVKVRDWYERTFADAARPRDGAADGSVQAAAAR